MVRVLDTTDFHKIISHFDLISGEKQIFLWKVRVQKISSFWCMGALELLSVS